MIPANQIIIRPPVEAYSVLIPVTGGCSWNRCRFCNTYRQEFEDQTVLLQPYEIRGLEDIFQDIDHWSSLYPKAINIFLAGGNALSVPTSKLVEILRRISHKFPTAQRISCYAKVLDILQKSEIDLKLLQEAGLTICYIGIESGSNTILKYMRKGQTTQMEIRAIRKLLNSGIRASIYIILGLGGRKWTQIHAEETATLINATNPTIFRFRTLNVLPGSPLEQDIAKGAFNVLSPYEILQEQYALLSKIDASITSKFRNDHISNYTSTESDNFGNDKNMILRELQLLLSSPEVKAWKHKNLKSM